MVAIAHRRRSADAGARVDMFEVARRKLALVDWSNEPKLGRISFVRSRLTIPIAPRKMPEFGEQTTFSVPQELITGIPEVDDLNYAVAAVYEEIALFRKEAYGHKCLAKKDAISFSREQSARMVAVYALRKTAEGLRDQITGLGGQPLPEPTAFASPV